MEATLRIDWEPHRATGDTRGLTGHPFGNVAGRKITELRASVNRWLPPNFSVSGVMLNGDRAISKRRQQHVLEDGDKVEFDLYWNG